MTKATSTRLAAPDAEQVRLLVAGDKSHCGKSTMSLGLLASLLDLGFAPAELAYIKPATQCVSTTLTAKFCESSGIDYVHVGPVVFYRNFTREFLDGKHGTSAELLASCANAVEAISAGKRFVVIDGVGYPTVGSIVGCSSVDIALACRARVLLVGKSGVGDAVDSFNLCAAVFEQRGVPVIGAVFNKLSLTGAYSLERCSEYVRKYFVSRRPAQHVYGLVPATDSLAALAAEESCGFSFSHPNPQNHIIRVEPLSGADSKAVANICALFKEHVDVPRIVADARAMAGASEVALSRANALELFSAAPSALLRQPATLLWVVVTAIVAHTIHALLAAGKLFRIGRGN